MTSMPAMTTHHVGELVIHAEQGWNNGNSPVGLMMAVRLHQLGRATDHVVHAASETCEHCGQRSSRKHDRQ